MAVSADLPMGQRIRYYRKRLGLSQKRFAELCGKTESWAWKVERGHHDIDRMSVILEVARVLRLRDLSQLIPKAYYPLTLDDGPEHDSVPDLRRALHTPPSLQPGDAVEVAALAAEVEAAWTVYNEHTIRYEVLGPLLPRLLAQAYRTIGEADAERAQAVRQCVSLLHLIQIYLRRVGSLPLSELAADRAMALADGLGDPALTSAAAWNVCCVLTSAGHVEASLDLALSTIGRYPIDGDAPVEHRTAHGALHLQAVIASVRAGDAPAAWDLLREAETIAATVPDTDDQWHTSFGGTNTAMHAVHLAAEEGDHAEALRHADHVADNPALPLERRTRYLIEVMNAHRLQRDTLGALFMAQKIQVLSPEEMRWHPLVRSAVAHLLENERPSYRAEVRDLAEHVGVLS